MKVQYCFVYLIPHLLLKQKIMWIVICLVVFIVSWGILEAQDKIEK